jgi:hypothetical protein
MVLINKYKNQKLTIKSKINYNFHVIIENLRRRIYGNILALKCVVWYVVVMRGWDFMNSIHGLLNS